jgi:DNA-binding YbaB/EbfC family protein
MKNLAGMMKQAQQMQSKMQEMQAKLEAMEITGEAGAGLVKVTMNGKSDMRKLKIDPKIVDPAETQMLEDLILAATRDARTKVEAMMAEEMQKVTGGIELPPGMKLPF